MPRSRLSRSRSRCCSRAWLHRGSLPAAGAWAGGRGHHAVRERRPLQLQRLRCAVMPLQRLRCAVMPLQRQHCENCRRSRVRCQCTNETNGINADDMKRARAECWHNCSPRTPRLRSALLLELSPLRPPLPQALLNSRVAIAQRSRSSEAFLPGRAHERAADAGPRHELRAPAQSRPSLQARSIAAQRAGR